MCYELTRRNLILTALGGLTASVGLKGLPANVSLEAIANHFMSSQSLGTLLAQTLADKADKKKSYLSGTDMSEWHAEAHPFLRKLAASGHVPSRGAIIELGSYQGQSLKVLNQLFGADRVRGCDIHNYTHNPQIVIQDVRSESFHMDSPALVWNDVSNWQNSPRSKLAAFNWAKKNLPRGGIYIDDGLSHIPFDLDLSGFEVLYTKDYITAFKKT